MKKLIKLALIVGALAFAAKLVAAKKTEWHGLTEAEVRDKLDARLPDRVPEEKRVAVADKVVSTMRARGVLREDQHPSPNAEGPDTGEASDSTNTEPDPADDETA